MLPRADEGALGSQEQVSSSSLSPGLRQVHGYPEASVLVPAEHPWAPWALQQVGDSQSQSNAFLGPTSTKSSWPMIAEVFNDGAETRKLQKKQAAQKAPSTDVGGKGEIGVQQVLSRGHK